MEIFKELYIENYGTIKINNSGTCVIGISGKRLSLKHRSEDGYIKCKFSRRINGKTKYIERSVHRLVALAFIPNPLNLPEVNHKDGNKENNSVDNLEWVTHVENVKHAWDTGLATKESHRGTKNGRHKLEENDIQNIRNLVSSGYTRYSVAKLYNIGWTTVDHVVKGHTWTHIK